MLNIVFLTNPWNDNPFQTIKDWIINNYYEYSLTIARKTYIKQDIWSISLFSLLTECVTFTCEVTPRGQKRKFILALVLKANYLPAAGSCAGCKSH